MKKHGKKYRAAAEKIDRTRKYNLDEAVKALKEISFAKFDETVELTIWLGVDPRKADQLVRGTLVLPHGLGRSKTVLVIAQGDKIKEAEEAGADLVGGQDMVDKIKGGWLDFDAVIATPDMMRLVGGLGKVLGPRGLMPNPKTGTVTFDVKTAVKETKAGKVEYRVDKTGVIHTAVGKVSFDEDKLAENTRALIEAVVKAKPSTAKGKYMKKVNLASTKMKTKAQKQTDLDALAEQFKQAHAAMLVSFKNMTVAKDQELRNQLREAGVSYSVVKNTLARKAAAGTPLEPMSDQFKGVTAVALSAADPVALSKAISKFTKANPDIFSFKVGLVEGKVVELKEVEAIASLPSREELISKVLFLINAQAQRLVTVIQAVPRNLAVVMDQVRAQKEAQGA